MINEYCPRCCELTNMTVSTAEKEEKKKMVIELNC